MASSGGREPTTNGWADSPSVSWQEHRQEQGQPSMHIPKVESIGVDESLFGRMLGYGTVIVRGTGGTFETFDKIAHPYELRRRVQQQTGNLVSA